MKDYLVLNTLFKWLMYCLLFCSTIEAYGKNLSEETFAMGFKAYNAYTIDNDMGFKGFETRNIKLSIAYFISALGLDDTWIKANRSQVYFYRAQAYGKLEKDGRKTEDFIVALAHDKAIEDFNAALELDDDWSRANRSQVYLARAVFYQHIEQDDKALADYATALNLDDEWGKANRSQIYYHRATANENLEKYFTAINDIANALKLDDSWIQANRALLYMYRADQYCLQEKYDLALEDYTAALALEKDNVNKVVRSALFYKRANVYVALKKYAQALEDCNTALALNDIWIINKTNRSVVAKLQYALSVGYFQPKTRLHFPKPYIKHCE